MPRGAKFINTPKPPYVAVIFTSLRTEVEEGYDKMNDQTYAEVEKIDGYIGYENFRNEEGLGVNISYWRDMEAAKNWKMNTLHQKAQTLGKEKWYKYYKIRICKVEREYEYTAS